jgi:mono/diheme cytochrome c family protein
MLLKKTFLFVSATCVLVSAFIACGDDKKEADKTAPAATPAATAKGGASGDTAKTLPASYAVCADCHGADGKGGGYPELKGTTLSEAEFLAIVKTGKPPMGANLVTQAEAKELWNYFKKE